MIAPVLRGTPHKKRQRRTNDEIGVLREHILDALRADNPQSVRHVFYLMTDPRLPCAVEKSERGYKVVQRQLADMRREGLLPYTWITDATRRGYLVSTFDGAADFIRRMAGWYRADAWRLSEHYVEVWAESRSIAAVIQDDCEELGVSLYPSGGFTSMTLAYQAAETISSRVADTGKTVEIIYIGDFDPAGVLIDRDIELKLRSHLGADIRLNFYRLGINADQVAEYDLPTKPRKKTDRRSPQVEWTVEAEAMPARILRRLLREKVESFMPAGALAVAKVAEDSERRGLLALANAIEGEGA